MAVFVIPQDFSWSGWPGWPVGLRLGGPGCNYTRTRFWWSQCVCARAFRIRTYYIRPRDSRLGGGPYIFRTQWTLADESTGICQRLVHLLGHLRLEHGQGAGAEHVLDLLHSCPPCPLVSRSRSYPACPLPRDVGGSGNIGLNV